MRTKRWLSVSMAALVASGLVLSGCAVNFYKQSPRSLKKIKDLETKIVDLEEQRKKELKQFEEAKRMLEQKLKGQIADKSVSLEMDDRGLVIILSDDILFDSGKAEVKSKAYPVLDKVASIIKKKVPDKNIGISGHTDNAPIKYSKWESNWKLSSERAINVLQYLESKGIPSKRLSATGYGEHRPVASNATVEGRSKNRRVEIVILPEFMEKRQKGASEDIK
ncbi:flagellar motor protein MotB [Candidatus Omnitrophota bacterium]